MILKVLGWCPGVEAAVNFNRENGYSWRKAAFYIMLFLLVVYGSAYIIFLLPESEPEPLVITLDGVDISEEDFSGYDFSVFYDKKVEFEMPIDYDEFAPAGTEEYVKTLYEFQDWEQAFTLLNETQTPNIVVSFAKWLRNGSLIEVGEKYHGSYERYQRWGNSDGSIEHYFGTNIERKTATFRVNRAQEIYPIYYELGVSERIVVEKHCVTDRGRTIIWELAIELVDSPPYRVLFIKYGRG